MPWSRRPSVRHAGRMTLGELARRAGTIARRRWGWLTVVAVAAGAVAVPSGVVLGWLSPAAGAWLTIRWMAGLWLALAAAGAALVVLVDQRPARRAVLATVGAVAVLLVCALPAMTFATFAVDHGQTGAACPECAVTAYLGSGPLGGFAHDDLTFSQALCAERREELKRQAAGMARDITAATNGAGISYLKAEASNDRARVNNDRATVVTTVRLRFTFTERQPAGVTGTTVDADTWTFGLVHDDGWRVCRVDAPAMCHVLDCAPAPPSPAVTPSPTATDDLLQHPREMLQCGPRDPFRELHNCPTPAPAPTPS